MYGKEPVPEFSWGGFVKYAVICGFLIGLIPALSYLAGELWLATH